jgi:hypothetical protein
MASSKKSKIIITPFVIGFLVILLSQIITATIYFLFVRYQFTHLSFEELKNLPDSFDSQVIGWINLLIRTAALIFAGYFVSRRIKEKGWLYGGAIGLIWFIFVLLLSLVPFLLPKDLIYGPNFPEQMAQANMDKRLTNLMSGLPLGLLKTVVLTAIGGFLGEYFAKRTKS